MIPFIESPQNQLIKHLVKLREERRYRSQQKTVLIIGEKCVREICSSLMAERLIVPNQDADTSNLLPAKQILTLSDPALKKASGQQSPDGWLAEVRLPPHSEDLGSKILVVACLQDPGNLGTILRTALALGWSGVWILENSVDPYNDKALRASKGAPFRLPMRYGDSGALLEYLSQKSVKLLIADMGGEDITLAAIQGPIALLMGNEGKGAPEKLKLKGKIVSVAMPGQMESLNVAVAAGILMHQINRSLS